MRIVFCGTADFAVPSLRGVAAAHRVLAVVTQPDRPGSRGRPAPRPVGDAAAALSLPVLRPERIRFPEAVADILALQADALVVAAYGQIIPAALLDGPTYGGVNVHGSLLPRWRGAAPVAAALLHGDGSTGVSIMRMDVGLDTGPVYLSRTVDIGPTETAPQLTARLAELGAAALLETLQALEAGTASATAQDDSQATLAPRLRREDGVVTWQEGAVAVDRRVRALQPWPGVTAPLGGREVRILDGAVADADAPLGEPGAVVGVVGENVDVSTAAGVYRVGHVQPPGGRAMTAAAYLRGRRAAE